RDTQRCLVGSEMCIRDSFLGPRPDVDALLAASDLFVLASDWDGLPVSILEAMRARRPVVVTAASGIPEAIRDGIEGILVPPRDPEALARAIAALFADPTRAARMGEAGRARFEAQFTTRRSAAALAAVYRNLLARQRYRSHAATGRKGMSARFACEPLAATAMESEER
ncbi:MAG: glycosyltransferase, partial [Candidatus Eisenbacteria bacterium]|nr:glycosyltransferase [Candidatus Eisenbacteria bacterium]